MEEIRAKLSAKSTLAVAITYALKRWPALTRYCEDGRLEIDNLIAERALQRIIQLWSCVTSSTKRSSGPNPFRRRWSVLWRSSGRNCRALAALVKEGAADVLARLHSRAEG